MKITSIEIECNAEEIKNCNSLANGISNALRSIFNSIGADTDYENEIEENKENIND